MDARRNAFQVLWLANVVLGSLIGLAYLDGLHLGDSPRLWLFAHLGLVSAVATISLVPLAFLWCLARLRLGDTARSIAQSIVWMLFQIALVIDTRVWGLFRYHFNSAAWNLITSKGSQDSYRLGARIWIFAISLGCLIALGEWLAWRFLDPDRRRDRAAPSRWRHPAWIGAALVVVAVGIEKSIYAKADLDQDRAVESVSRALPLYPRLQVSEILPEPLKEGLEPWPRVPVAYEGARLCYPLQRPRVDPSGPRPNILVLVVDSWRQDMLDAEVTPRLFEFAGDARRFDDHLSGGNGTRFGVFSMIYGLHGSYWWPVLEAERSPVLLDTLGELGYELRVYSSASMDYPEFRRTAWKRITDQVFDDFGERRPSERDALAARACVEWWRQRDASRPFFAFVLLDSAHQKYDFPEGSAPFEPYAREIDYLEMAGSREPELVERVRNRYRNALHHADSVAAGLLDELARSGALESTLVVVTGDHGEEFAENGYWGHTGNFSAEQVAVPFLLRGPGVAKGVESAPTSHVDLPATLLEMLGADSEQRALWSNGEHLLRPLARRERVVAGWEELGLWADEGIFRAPRDLEAGARASVCDRRWQLIADQRGAFARARPALDALVESCSRFLEVPTWAALGTR